VLGAAAAAPAPPGAATGAPGNVAAITMPACVPAPVEISAAPSRGHSFVPAGKVLLQVGQLGTAVGRV
jgi:hypothetical protein